MIAALPSEVAGYVVHAGIGSCGHSGLTNKDQFKEPGIDSVNMQILDSVT